MRTSFTVLLGVTLATGLLITGCKKEGTMGPSSDQTPAGVSNELSAMQVSAVADQYVVDGSDVYAFVDPKVATTNYDDSFAKVDDAITPLRWGRTISAVTRTVTVSILPGDTLSVAHVARMVTGILKIKTRINGVDTLLAKSFTDTSSKNVIFFRVGHDAVKYWKNWLPVASSLVSGATSPAPAGNAIAITTVEVRTSSDTLTITDPSAYWLRYRWLMMGRGGRKDVPQFRMGDSVTVRATVMSQVADTDLVALREGFGLRSLRFKRAQMALVSQSGPDGSGYYTRVYEKHLVPRFFVGDFHLGVDALTKSTLYDSTAPYSVSWWGVPFRMF